MDLRSRLPLLHSDFSWAGELRLRYKFKRRTPSDIYSHAGEELGAEYGVGI
jgi:hypothetical protein